MSLNYLILQVLAACTLLCELGCCSKTCQTNMWPIYAGGRAQETMTSCLVYDRLHRFVIAGGTATDMDITGEQIRTGFVYALDVQGNWMWSHTFYNETDHMNEISKCILTSDEASLAVFGKLNNLPAIFTMDLEFGQVQDHVYI